MSSLFSNAVSENIPFASPLLDSTSNLPPTLSYPILSYPILYYLLPVSSQTRFSTWRQLWLNLAIAEKELGLEIPDEAITQMKANLVSVNHKSEGTIENLFHFPLGVSRLCSD